MENVNARMKILIDNLTGGRQTFFAEKLGVAQSTINAVVGKRQTKPGYDLLSKIKKVYPEINIDWIITGEGEMFIKSDKYPDENLMSVIKEKDTQLLEKDRFITELLKLVPLEKLGKLKVIDLTAGIKQLLPGSMTQTALHM